MLLGILREHYGPLRADFRRCYGLVWVGWRVPGVGLRETADLAVYLPAESATKRALGGGWTLAEQLAALNADRLAVLIWQKTADGQKGRAQPKPLPRPGFEDESSSRVGTARMSLRQARRWLARRRAGGTEEPHT